MTSLVDTHCHIHDSNYDFLIEDVLKQAQLNKIDAMICVGTDLKSSQEALDFCLKNPNCYASLGLHPHLGVKPLTELREMFKQLRQLSLDAQYKDKLVAIGECGLDYFYHHDSEIKARQKQIFQWQLNLAGELNLPLIFHVRSAFEDFWSIYDDYKLPGSLHSFSDSLKQVERGLTYDDLYFGLNGIMTFSQDKDQLLAAKSIPSSRLLLETDAPYLTPKPFRGKMNKPHYLRQIANFLIDFRNEEDQLFCRQTTKNAQTLFNIAISTD
ncbi:MAG: TatD family hydrolase [Candidatus Saccharibacteria bacterium]|nr:TatD family hydrolase [Candidatus Saccharibacteria bacterium]